MGENCPPMSSCVKSGEEIGEKRKGVGRYGVSSSFFWHDEDCFSEKARLRYPARIVCEFGILAKTQIIESEEWLFV
jgi:hypothetical protein